MYHEFTGRKTQKAFDTENVSVKICKKVQLNIGIMQTRPLNVVEERKSAQIKGKMALI